MRRKDELCSPSRGPSSTPMPPSLFSGPVKEKGPFKRRRIRCRSRLRRVEDRERRRGGMEESKPFSVLLKQHRFLDLFSLDSISLEDLSPPRFVISLLRGRSGQLRQCSSLLRGSIVGRLSLSVYSEGNRGWERFGKQKQRDGCILRDALERICSAVWKQREANSKDQDDGRSRIASTSFSKAQRPQPFINGSRETRKTSLAPEERKKKEGLDGKEGEEGWGRKSGLLASALVFDDESDSPLFFDERPASIGFQNATTRLSHVPKRNRDRSAKKTGTKLENGNRFTTTTRVRSFSFFSLPSSLSPSFAVLYISSRPGRGDCQSPFEVG